MVELFLVLRRLFRRCPWAGSRLQLSNARPRLGEIREGALGCRILGRGGSADVYCFGFRVGIWVWGKQR